MSKTQEASGGLMLMPPAKDCCQICAVKHEPTEAHNAQSLYYGMRFLMAHGRDATWADAIAHCPPKVKELWERELRLMNAWTEPAAGCPVIVERSED